MATKYKHYHKYKRVKWGKNETVIYRCMVEGCGHYLHPEMMRGKIAQCWTCPNTFTINLDKLRYVKPRCDSCQKGSKDPFLVDNLDSLLKDL